MIDPNFWNKKDLKYIIYGDTDSLYINLPDYKRKESIEETWNDIVNLSNDINNIISDYLNKIILPKLGISSEYNHINFKPECLITDMLLLGIKKNYAYKKIAKKGILYKEPITEYKGIPIIKSNFSKFSQSFIKYIVENIIFGDNIDNPIKLLNEFVYKKRLELEERIYDFDYVGMPGKWKIKSYSKETFIVVGMRLYNTLFNSEIFKPGISGLSFPIIINENNFLDKISINKSKSIYFLNNINIDLINYMVIPYNYDINLIKNKLNEYNILIDKEKLWNISLTKITKTIIDILKKESMNV